MTLRNLDPVSTKECPAECSLQQCKPGNIMEIGGKYVTGNFCVHNCSVTYNGVRFCGAGTNYQGAGVIDCGGCAHPAMCDGLPCWVDEEKRVVQAADAKR